MATGANAMLDRDDGGVAFAHKKALELIQQIFVDFAGELLTFFPKLLQAHFKCFRFFAEIIHLARDRILRRGCFFFFGADFDFQFIALLHQLELLVLEFSNFIFVALDFVTHRLELVVLARLILLCLQAVDAFGSRSDVELEFFALDLDLLRFMFDRIAAGRTFRKLQFEMFALQRQIFYLILDLPDLLLSILKDEKLFQFGAHVALKLVSLRSGVNRTQRLLWPRANGYVLRQIHPLNDAVPIDVKLGRAGDVVPFWSRAAV